MMAAGKFKDVCLEVLDEVARTKSIVIKDRRIQEYTHVRAVW